MEKRNLVHPQLVGKMIQKIEQDAEGSVYIHTKSYVLKLRCGSGYGEYPVLHELSARAPKPEPITVTGKFAK